MSGALPEVTFTQRSGLRGVRYLAVLFVIYIPFVWLYTGGGRTFANLVGLAVASIILHLALYSGPHRRGVTVTSTVLRYGRSTVPLTDVVEVLVTDRAGLRRLEFVRADFVPPGPRGGVALRLVSPEGIESGVGITVDDPEGLAATIEQRRQTATRPPFDATPQPLPYTGRQGLARRQSLWLLTPALLGDAWLIVFGGELPIGVPTGVIAGLLGWMWFRPVRIDDAGLRVGTASVSWSEVESVRVATLGEVLQLPRARARAPLWGPSYALVVLRRARPGDGDRPPHRRTDVLAIPEPVDLSGVRVAGPPSSR